MEKSLILHDGEYKKLTRDKSIALAPSTENAIPNMTSNTLPHGKVYYGSVYGSQYDGWKAFNSTDSAESYITAYGVTAGFLAYEFTSPIIIIKYTVRGNGHPAYIKAMIKSWTFEGSNNTTNGSDGDWEILDTQTNQTWDTLFSNKDYIINNKIPYKTYRINFTENNMPNAYSEIGQLMMYGMVEKEVYGELYWGNENLENIVSEGMDSLSPLLNRRVTTLEPLPMTEDSTQTETGKLFSKTLNLNKYIDIRNIKMEVK